VSSVPVVYVATGSNYPDALSAGAPAALQGGPLLLTQGDTLPGSVKTEIQRLNPQKIVVVGGVNSVSATVFNQLKALQSNIVRLAGADRYAASRNIVDYAFGSTGADTVYISTGANFPDALSAGGAGGAHNTPVLLVNGTAPSLDAATVALLQKLKVKHIKIAGGPNSVSPALQTQLNTIAPTIRLSGADRFAASQSINEDAYSSASRVFLATGFNFPDALAGSAWAGSLHAPLYVVPGSCVPQQIINDIVHLGATQVTLIGGTASLTQNVQNLQSCL
jgi:putative cell wall-binding protein